MQKTVLITGAGKGIGKAIALKFAEEGYKVAFFDKDQELVKAVENELRIMNTELWVDCFDILDATSLDNLLRKVGNVDVLVNNVGFGKVKRFYQTTEKDLMDVYNVNFKAPFFLTQKIAAKMRKGSSIIFITSIHGVHPSLDPSYDSSKSAVDNLIINLALGLAKDGIRVNGVAPGHIDVSGSLKVREQPDVPLYKEAGTPEDVAESCLFLADDKKARYITGIILPVTGGLHIPIARDIKF